MGFSQQKYLSGLSFPPPEHILDPGIEPVSLVAPALQEATLRASHILGKPLTYLTVLKINTMVM